MEILKNKKSAMLIISICVLFIIGLLINYLFLKPTKLNYLIANNIYKAPANNAFTDENFYKCIVDAYNEQNQTNLDYSTSLTDEQLNTVTHLNCDEKNITNAKGIEKLSNLTRLSVDNNQLTSLDVSNNPKLTYLYARSNQLTSLDVSHNPNLTILYANDNQLMSLDVSHNPALEYLYAYNNQLTSLDVSGVTALTKLYAYNNQLTSLDVSHNLELKSFSVSYNQLTSLDVSHNLKLEGLYAYNNKLISLDVSNNAKLIRLEINNNQLTSLDVDKNLALRTLYIENNQLTSLDVSHNPDLTYINVSSNQLTGLDVSNNFALKSLSISYNQLTSLDVSNNSALELLGVSYNQLINLDINNNPSLVELSVSHNQLTSLDVSHNPALKILGVLNNQLTSLDVSHNPNLTTLNVLYNQLTSLDVSKNVELTGLYVGNNKLKTLNLSKNVNLKKLDLLGNSFGYSVAVYKGGSFDFSTDYGAIKFPEGFETEYISMSDDSIENFGSIIDGTVIIPNELAGLQFVKYNYTNNNGISGNYELTYGIYTIELFSNKYKIMDEYIYVSNDLNLINLNNLKFITTSDWFDLPENNQLTLKQENSKLQVYQEHHLLKEFNVIGLDFGNLKTSKDLISITEDVPYEDFTNNITISEGLTYKIFNADEEITNGNISVGMNLKVYYNDEVIDTYEITDEYLDLSLLNVDEDKDLIKDLVLGTKVSEFKEKISTSGNITIVDKNNEVLTDDKLITSGAKVKIELTNETYKYTLSVKGDVRGTGTSTVSDVAKLYQFLKGKITMEDCYKEAGNVVSTDNEIKINDVAKLYQFIKKKISSLEV